MPSGVVHMIFGVPAGVAVLGLAAQQGHPPDPMIAAAGIIGSLWPDWDATGSTITTITGRRSPVSWVSIAVSRIIQGIFGHRGAFHSVLFGTLFGLAAYFWLGLWMAAAFGLGYLSHLLADELFTKSRVPWWWPFHRRRRHRRVPLKSKASSRSRRPQLA